MQLKFKDVAHHYLGVKCIRTFEGKLRTLTYTDINTMFNFKFKPTFKPIEWLTDEEYIECLSYANVLESGLELISLNDIIHTALITHYLCNKGYDVFNLIKIGEAIAKEYELKSCDKCIQMTNHIGNQCQKCKAISETKNEGE